MSHHLRSTAISLKPCAMLRPNAMESPVLIEMNQVFPLSVIGPSCAKNQIVKMREKVRVRVIRKRTNPWRSSVRSCFLALKWNCKCSESLGFSTSIVQACFPCEKLSRPDSRRVSSIVSSNQVLGAGIPSYASYCTFSGTILAEEGEMEVFLGSKAGMEVIGIAGLS
jgi:hypothetical protein